MAKISIEGLDGDFKQGILWLSIGFLLAPFADTPPLFLLSATVAGICLAAARYQFMAHGITKWADRITLILSISSILLVVGSSPLGLKPLQLACPLFIAMGLGEFLPTLLRRRLEHALSLRYAPLLHALEPAPKRTNREPGERNLLWDRLDREFPNTLWKTLRESETPSLAYSTGNTPGQTEPISRLGGTPWLPTDFIWPSFQCRPLKYLGQLNLEELQTRLPTPFLPTAGTLSFFYDLEASAWGGTAEDMGSGFVHYLHPSQFPVALTWQSENEGKGFAIDSWNLVPSVRMDEETENKLFKLRHALPKHKIGLLDGLLEPLIARQDSHTLLGHPNLVQNSLAPDLLVASRAYGLPENTHWRFVAQFESDQKLNWCWGDAGCLYFSFPENDLLNGDFSRCWVSLQCT